MTKLTNLMTYSEPLTQLLLSLPSSSWNQQPTLGPLPHEQDPRIVLGRWTIDVIDTLTALLDAKARALLRPRSSMASNLFLLNNLSEVEKRVRKSSLMASVVGSISAAERERDVAGKRGSRGSSGSGATAVFTMPKGFEKAKRGGLDGTLNIVVPSHEIGYLDGYKDAVSHLLDVTYIKGASNRTSGTLTGKEREAVKERFKVVNRPFSGANKFAEF